MKAINILAMLLAFNGFCHSKAIQAQDLAIRSLVDYSDLIIRSDDIADGFEAAGQGPTVTKVDSNNETIAIAYIMDQEDWDAMHDHLLEKAYNERLKEALAQSPQEDHDQLREDAQRQLLEALNPKSLVERVDIQDPKTWLCNENGPLVSPQFEESHFAANNPGCEAIHVSTYSRSWGWLWFNHPWRNQTRAEGLRQSDEIRGWRRFQRQVWCQNRGQD